MRTRRRIALLVASCAALGVAIALPASAAAAPPVIATCTPKASTGSDSCVRGVVTAVDGSLGTAFEPIRLGTRVRSVFDPSTHESTQVIIRYDDDGQINLTGIPTCPAAEVVGKNIAAAWEQCGPGADGNPSSEGNAFLSTGLGPNVSGIGSTVAVPGIPSGFVACTMIFKGVDNAHITIYARAPAGNNSATTGCNNPATNTSGTTTVVFTGTLSHQPVSSPYDWTLTVPNTQAANPALDDFYATVVRGSAFRARCMSPMKVQATWFYTPSTGDPADTVSPPYPGTTDPCPP